MSNPSERRATLVRLITTALVVVAITASAQPTARKASTVPTLLTYPVFYHGQRVVVRAPIVVEDQLAWLAGGDTRVLCFGCPFETDESILYEATGVFWDVGRLEADDPRLDPHDPGAIAERLLDKPWPASGELPALVTDTDQVEVAESPPTLNVRTVALDPGQYESQEVTLAGRFRGRNLYGDLPAAPRQSRWDFVLQSADGSVWVTGIEPSGREFSLDPNARVDTNRWIEVRGTIHQGRGLVWLEATEIALAEPPADTPVASVAVPPRPPGPPPEVIFSTPTPEDTDVPVDTTVRVQFSRDMDEDSFEEGVHVSYLQAPSPEGIEPPIDFTVSYDGGNRVLEIRFPEALEPYRTVKVELVDAIAAHDGIPMDRSWVLTFTLGGT